jgi:hypothetical protein
MTTDIQGMAATADQVVKGFMQVEPLVMTGLSFIPGAAPVTAIVHPAVAFAAPFIEQALEQIAAGNNGNAWTAFVELLSHITPGKANSPILSGPIKAE